MWLIVTKNSRKVTQNIKKDTITKCDKMYIKNEQMQTKNHQNDACTIHLWTFHNSSEHPKTKLHLYLMRLHDKRTTCPPSWRFSSADVSPQGNKLLQQQQHPKCTKATKWCRITILLIDLFENETSLSVYIKKTAFYFWHLSWKFLFLWLCQEKRRKHVQLNGK